MGLGQRLPAHTEDDRGFCPAEALRAEVADLELLVRQFLLLRAPEAKVAPSAADEILDRISRLSESCAELAADPVDHARHLAGRRKSAADRIFQAHDFGVPVEGHGGWRHVSLPGADMMMIDVYLEGDGGQETRLVLEFEPGRSNPASIRCGRLDTEAEMEPS